MQYFIFGFIHCDYISLLTLKCKSLVSGSKVPTEVNLDIRSKAIYLIF